MYLNDLLRQLRDFRPALGSDLLEWSVVCLQLDAYGSNDGLLK